MCINWHEEDDDEPEDKSDGTVACDPDKLYQVVITITSMGDSPIARIDHSFRSGAIGLPAFLLKEYARGYIADIDATAYATRLQLGHLLNYSELYKQHDLSPPDYTPGKEMAAAEILSASLLEHIHTIRKRLESE